MSAVDIYKQVIGRLNFAMDAVVGMVLLIPAVIAFLVDCLMQKKQVALLSARAVPLISSSNRREAYGNSIRLALYTAII